MKNPHLDNILLNQIFIDKVKEEYKYKKWHIKELSG